MPANAYEAAYHEESDADDEYERSLVTSPTLPTVDYESSSPTESDPLSNQPTPTTFTHTTTTAVSPRGLITDWGADQVADFVRSLGLEQYRNILIKEGINGEVVVQLQQSNLKDMGILSVGHRLTILKAVYEVKLRQNVTIEEDDYVPLSADANAPDAHATQHDVARIIEQITLRDNRIRDLEMDLRTMKEDLNRIQDEQRKMREDTLPIIRMAKDKSHPLPTPDSAEPSMPSPGAPPPSDAPKSGGTATTATRRPGSRLPWFGGNSNKVPSPTIHDNVNLDPSAAASAASTHLTNSFNSESRGSPHMSNQPSPTSPPYNTNSHVFPARYARNDSLPPQTGANQPWLHAAQPQMVPETDRSSQRSAIDMQRGVAPQRAPENRPSPNTNGPPSTGSVASPEANDPTGFMKSFRVSMEEPCYKVLPVALKKYNIHDDPSQYSLYIVHGDQERCLGLDERPLILFKQLANEGKKPMFMLRKHATPVEGFNHTRGDGATGTVRGPLGSLGGGGGGVGGGGGGGSGSRIQSYASYNSTQLPGGVL